MQPLQAVLCVRYPQVPVCRPQRLASNDIAPPPSHAASPCASLRSSALAHLSMRCVAIEIRTCTFHLCMSSRQHSTCKRAPRLPAPVPDRAPAP